MAARTNDACLRAALKARLKLRHHVERDVFIVEELPTKRASGRLDVVVLNGYLHGYEIKSDLDTLERLPRQVEAFAPAMQQMTLVVAERHAETAVRMIPDWWGVATAGLRPDGSVGFRTRRRGRRNTRIEARPMAELLERDELLAMLRRHDADRGVRTAGYDAVVNRAIASFPVRALVDEVREALKFRAAWEAAETLTAFGRTAIALNAAVRDLTFARAPAASGAG